MKKIFSKVVGTAIIAAPLFLSSALMADDTLDTRKAAMMSSVSPTPVMAAASIGPVTFGAPWVLFGLASLPLLWWLMRSVPPKPKEEDFPAIRLLFGLKEEDQEPVRMPLWQRSLRITAAGLVIAGLAQPQLNPDQALSGDKGPVMLVVDNDWASAPRWEDRAKELEYQIDRAAQQNRPVIVLPTAPPADGGPVQASGPFNAREARRVMFTMQPQSWPADRAAALAALQPLTPAGDATVVWLSNGLDDGSARALADRLQEFGSLKVLRDGADALPYLLLPPDTAAEAMEITVRRPDGGKGDALTLSASDESGRIISQTQVAFEAGQAEAKARFELPLEMRNQVVRVGIDGENGAGAVLLMDERWRRRPVGLIEAGRAESAQSLLNESRYIERALDPYVDLRRGAVDELLKKPTAVMVLTDNATLDDALRGRLDDWVQAGGTLLRFAGPRLAAQAEDKLVPVPLRPGERVLGGALSGTKPGRLAPFEEGSPFHGIHLSGDITITREVLAQPGLEVEEHTWARLDDGTPLVTAKQSGKGWIILVHTTANTDWSNLALSGTFVDMMRAVVSYSQGVSGASGFSGMLPPLKTLDGHGQLGSPGSGARPLNREAVEGGDVSARHPPGFYGNESLRQAHNLAAGATELRSLSAALPEDAASGVYEGDQRQKDLRGLLLAGALALLLADMVILLGQQGHLQRGRQDKPQAPAPKNV